LTETIRNKTINLCRLPR